MTVNAGESLWEKNPLHLKSFSNCLQLKAWARDFLPHNTAEKQWGAQVLLKQSRPSVTVRTTRTARIECVAQGISGFQSAYIHWYQHMPSRAPQRILYIGSGQATYDDNSYRNKYTSWNCTVIAKTLFTVSGYYNKVFGSGTKLIVSGKLHAIFHATKQSRPANFEILQKEHKNQIMYVCLIEKFYPDVIRVTWTDKGNKIVEGDNIVKGDAWKPTKEDKYSISSWLTVPAEKKDENYYCNYEHETGKESVTKQGI
uniref:Ig-like domain-containing protein n=1 Tax=Calidris pygmaea TaxID=425635 RepID=A0A8C3KK08_9CHAR